VNRRDFLHRLGSGALTAMALPAWSAAEPQAAPGLRLVDVTSASGIQFRHRSGAAGGKLLPETMGAGCAFLDYDGDGWQDILFVNGMDWPGHKQERSTLRLYRNNRNGTFSDVTRSAGLDVEMYGMGVAVGDWNNDGFPDLLVTSVGQNRLFRNTGKGTFVDVTKTSGLGGRTAFSTSALWFDFDRDGWLDLFVCNYVKWSAEHDVFCSADGKKKSYCTPEAYRGDTCWLFRNRGNGTFEDVTATSGIFDSSSKSLGVALLDDDQDGWLDLIVANDTQPNKLYRNLRNGKFKEVGVQAGVAFSADGRARAGMGIDSADFDNSGRMGVAVTNFDNEMAGLYRPLGPGLYADVAMSAGVGAASRNRLGFGCLFADLDLDGLLDLVVANGHIDDEAVRTLRSGVGHAQPPLLFLNQGNGKFQEAATAAGTDFARPRVGRGLAYGDFDRDGDVDLLMTTNNGPAVLFRNDQVAGNRSVRFKLVGTKSNRDAVGARVRVFHDGITQSRLVKTGSSYLSQSELPVTFGVGKRDRVERVVIDWPSGRTEEFKGVVAGKAYECVEGKGMSGGARS
jgi:enediyne biosynthesis protein E4